MCYHFSEGWTLPITCIKKIHALCKVTCLHSHTSVHALLLPLTTLGILLLFLLRFKVLPTLDFFLDSTALGSNNKMCLDQVYFSEQDPMKQQVWKQQKTLVFSKIFLFISDMLIQMIWLVHCSLKDQLVGMETTLRGFFFPLFSLSQENLTLKVAC